MELVYEKASGSLRNGEVSVVGLESQKLLERQRGGERTFQELGLQRPQKGHGLLCPPDLPDRGNLSRGALPPGPRGVGPASCS